jgi:hypothetical protein
MIAARATDVKMKQRGHMKKTQPEIVSDSGYPLTPVCKALGITVSVRELHRASGLDVGHCSRILSGLRRPRPPQARIIAATLTELSGRQENPITIGQLFDAIEEVEQSRPARKAS